MMAVMLTIAAALRNWLGEAGVATGAIVAGFVPEELAEPREVRGGGHQASLGEAASENSEVLVADPVLQPNRGGRHLGQSDAWQS